MAVYPVRFLPTAPPLDGVGRAGSWSSLPDLGPFVRHDGAPARLATHARLGYDEQRLYVAFHCLDDDVWGTFRNRDDPIYDEEVVEVFLDPAGTGARYFEIEVSPHNVVLDGVNTWADGELTWDARWDCAELVTAVACEAALDRPETVDTWWSATLAIPFASLGQEQPAPGRRWRANLYRIDRPRRGEPEEYQAWQPTQEPGRDPMYNVPARFGTIEFAGG